jgi:hypothetical protein
MRNGFIVLKNSGQKQQEMLAGISPLREFSTILVNLSIDGFQEAYEIHATMKPIIV